MAIIRNESFDERSNTRTILFPGQLALGAKGGVALAAPGFHRPMYQDLSEVLGIVITVVKETTGNIWVYRRTIESGAVEEFVIMEEAAGTRKLMFRVWPVLYAHDRRIEYKSYFRDPELNRFISEHLHICARANGARLALKE